MCLVVTRHYRQDEIELTRASHNLVFSTGEPAYAVNRQGEILAWNDAATVAFGYPTAQALGRFCWELLRGRDVFGNEYCGKYCPHRAMAARRQPINRCHLKLATALGGHKAFTVSTLSLFDQPGDDILIHLCKPGVAGSASPTEAHQGTATSGIGKGRSILTPRETEVLQALAEGRATREIATLLSISIPTVRNHIEHLLHKLNCHSRLEAVAAARRLNLL